MIELSVKSCGCASADDHHCPHFLRPSQLPPWDGPVCIFCQGPHEDGHICPDCKLPTEPDATFTDAWRGAKEAIGRVVLLVPRLVRAAIRTVMNKETK